MSAFSKALQELAEPRPIGDTVQAAIVRASRISGIPYPRAFNIWYRRARRIDAEEAQLIVEALDKKREEEARNEIQDLRTRLLKMESRIAAENANSRRRSTGPAGPSLPGFGSLGSALARGGR